MSDRRRAGAAGFTLVELVVAITLFAMLSALLVGGFRFGSRVWEQAEVTAAQVTEVEAAYSVIRRLLTSALPIAGATPEGDVHADFWGEADGVSFVGPAPAQAFVGGLHTITLARVAGPTGQRLVLNVRPFVADDGIAAPLSRKAKAADRLDKSVVLVDGATAIEFLYFGNDDSGPAPRWRSRWAQQPMLPRLVRVRVAFAAGDRRIWPDLIAQPAVLELGY